MEKIKNNDSEQSVFRKMNIKVGRVCVGGKKKFKVKILYGGLKR